MVFVNLMQSDRFKKIIQIVVIQYYRNSVATSPTVRACMCCSLPSLFFYRWLGVDHVFLFDNDSNNKTILQQLRGEFSRHYLTISEVSQPHAQLPVYAQCIEEQRAHFNWIAFFDLDEYLVIRDPYAFLLFASSLILIHL